MTDPTPSQNNHGFVAVLMMAVGFMVALLFGLCSLAAFRSVPASSNLDNWNLMVFLVGGVPTIAESWKARWRLCT
jgi:hypothetical protein